jgi:hypothetical protein
LSTEDVINGDMHSEAAKVHAQTHFVSTGETPNMNIQNGFWSQACATVTIILTWGLIGHDLNGSSTAFTIAVLIKYFELMDITPSAQKGQQKTLCRFFVYGRTC